MIKKWVLLIFFLFLNSLLFANQEIKVCYYHFPPMLLGKNGEPQGFFIDMLNYMAKLERWKLNYSFGTWQQCFDRLKSGEIDLIPAIGENKERKKLFDFTDEFLFMDWSLIYRQKNSSINNIFDLKNKRIGVLKGSIYEEELKNLLQQFGVQALIIGINQYSEILAALEKGELDAGVSSNIYSSLLKDDFSIERTGIVFAPIKLKFSVKKHRSQEIIDKLNNHIFQLKKNKNSYYYEKYKDWFGIRNSNPFLKTLEIFFYILAAVIFVLALFVYFLRLAVKKKTKALFVANEQLYHQEERYKSLFEYSPVAMWEEDFSGIKKYLDTLENEINQDIEGYLKKDSVNVIDFLKTVRIADLNRANLNLYESSSKEELIMNLPLTFIPESVTILSQQIAAIYRQEKIFYSEGIIKTLKGNLRNIYFQWQVLAGCEKMYEKVLISIVDITNLKNKEKELQISLNEKDVLLNEIHHRVKNNLQIISSLLQLGMSKLENGAPASAVLRESINRIETIALIHKQLYSMDNFACIHVENYIRELLNMLLIHYESNKKIDFEIDCQSIDLNMNLMLPLGLIINELAVNSLKHAFLNQREGKLFVGVRENNNREIELIFRDNGSGLPEGFNIEKADTFGFQIIKNLLKQIKGSLEIKNEGGLFVKMIFFQGINKI